MAAINFPAASESPWYNSETGVTYVYENGAWRAASSAADSFDTTYVKKSGDNMTGSLTLGGTQITLNSADGSASFANTLTAAGAITTGDTSNNGIVLDQSGAAAGYFGGSENWVLAASGSASFTNSVDGYYFRSNEPNSNGGGSAAFLGQLNGVETSRIRANGSASFASAIDCTAYLEINRDSDANNAFLIRPAGGGTSASIAGNGAATFAGGDFTISTGGETIIYGQLASGYDAVAGNTRDYGHVCVSRQNSTGNYATGYFRNMNASGRAIYVADSLTGDTPTFEVSASGTAISHNLGGPHFIARGGTGGAYSLYQNNATGTAVSDGLLVGYLATGGYLWNYEASPLLFGVASDERGRFNSQGYLQLSNTGGSGSTRYGDDKTYHAVHTSADGGAICLFENTSNNPYGIYVQMAGAAPNNDSNYFISCEDSGSQKFYVFSSGNVRNATNSYGAISDVSVKQNIVDSGSQWDDIKDIRVRKFKLKADVKSEGTNAKTMLGVVAQEVEKVSPGLVTTNEDTGEKSVAYSVLYMKSVKALQEAMARIESLETRIAELEAN